MKIKAMLGVAALAIAAATPASAATFVVEALANSSSGGTGLPSLALTAGQTFTVSSSINDLWSAGALPRYSDANGLVAPRFATAADDSGQPVGTQIGADFGLWSQDGFDAPYGTLVGLLNGSYLALGANGTYVAPSTGTLQLFYWDSNAFDNFGEITFQIAVVPEPATWGMMIAGFGVVGGTLRRQRRTLAAA